MSHSATIPPPDQPGARSVVPETRALHLPVAEQPVAHEAEQPVQVSIVLPCYNQP